MNKQNQYLLIGLVTTSISIAATACVSSANANELLCYIQTRDGQQIDLSRICNKKTSPTPANPETTNTSHPTAPSSRQTAPDQSKIPAIDPKMPAKIPLVLKDKPSALWNSVPDLPYPAIEGSTTQP
jgi:hypothetical protein